MDHAADLTLPLGLPGSGKRRYAAAMALWRDGKIPAVELEAYRICAPLDDEDPARVLAEWGLRLTRRGED